MAKLRLTPAAKADLAEIRSYSVEQFGAEVADVYFRGFKQAFAMLSAFPEAGAPQTKFRQPIRCYLHRSHRIFYLIEGDVVRVARVLHRARDAGRLLS